MKKQPLLLLLLLITSNLFAQNEQSFHFGLKAAPSLAWLRSDTKGYNSDGSKFGFSYGLITDFNFASRYAFGTGIDVTYRGGKFKSVVDIPITGGDSIITTTASYTLQYVEIPITLKLKTNEIGSFTYFLQIGVAPGLSIRAREDYTETIQTKIGTVIHNEPSTSADKVDVMKYINNFNLSMIIGAGLEYTLSGETVLLTGIQFNNGFTDIFDNDAKVNANYLALTIGVLF